MYALRFRGLPLALLALSLVSCGKGKGGGTRAVFDLSSAHDTPLTFWEQPFPSDLRLTSSGAPDMTGFFVTAPFSPGEQLKEAVAYRKGWPQMPVGYFRFEGPLGERVETETIAADIASPLLLIDVDPDSAERGMLFPVVAKTLGVDDYAPAHLLAVAARPGVVLRRSTTYALVVRSNALDAAGKPLVAAPAIARLAAGQIPAGGEAAATLFAPLWTVLDEIGVARTEVVNATVFTTGDVVGILADMSTQLIAQHTATITNPVLDPVDGAHPDFCEVKVDLTVPQFVTGVEPWDSEGRFALDAAGLPIKQSDRVVKAVLTIPRAAMPTNGFPLLLYFHGSGGVHDQVVDAGRSTVAIPDGTIGEGPAMWFARQGVAAAASAQPVSPDRVPGAGDTQYVNLANLGNLTFNFRQGVIEQRLFTTALLNYHLPMTALAGCSGVTLPGGATDVFFDAERFFAGGQSQGGMYTNFFGAVDPRPRALLPTGAGGLWPIMITTSRNFEEEVVLLGQLVGTTQPLTFVHPVLNLVGLAWETSEPMVFAPHLSRRPLPGYPARPIYEPVGEDDGYFNTRIYDAIALAYGHEQAGDVVWTTMQDSLALGGHDGVLAYPVSNNVISENGTPYTGVVVQYQGDGFIDAHAIYRQRDEVIYQYGCFLRTLIDTGVAVVPAPAALGTVCPTN